MYIGNNDLTTQCVYTVQPVAETVVAIVASIRCRNTRIVCLRNKIVAANLEILANYNPNRHC